MCTAITYRSGDFYLRRNLDLNMSYSERVTVMPRKFSFPMKCLPDLHSHYALIGMALKAEGWPPFFEATNEKGLSMAGLNFPDNAFYGETAEDKTNLATYELIPWFSGNFSCVAEAKETAKRLNVVRIPFSKDLPLSSLRWIISDKIGSLTLKNTAVYSKR